MEAALEEMSFFFLQLGSYLCSIAIENGNNNNNKRVVAYLISKIWECIAKRSQMGLILGFTYKCSK